MIKLPWQKGKAKRAGILLGGGLKLSADLSQLLFSCDYLLAADSGARYARSLELDLDLALGDFDSISQEDYDWLLKKNVPLLKFQEDKDETDAELAAYLALARDFSSDPAPKASFPLGSKSFSLLKKGPSEDSKLSLIKEGAWEEMTLRSDLELIFFAVTGSRSDHFLANLFLAEKLVKRDIPTFMTDGQSLFLFFKGPSRARIVWPQKPRPGENWLFSALALDDEIEGLSYKGAKFLAPTKLPRGTSMGLSNSCQNPEQLDFELELKEGSLLVILSRED